MKKDPSVNQEEMDQEVTQVLSAKLELKVSLFSRTFSKFLNSKKKIVSLLISFKGEKGNPGIPGTGRQGIAGTPGKDGEKGNYCSNFNETNFN